MRRVAVGATLAWVAALPRPAQAADEDLCTAAIAAAGKGASMPANLLAAVALVESGRPVGGQVGGRVAPWPWAVNVEGASRFFASKAEAMEAVQAMQAAGTQSIDVGCMQINLRMHPHAFEGLSDAFDPEANVRYGAAFLRALFTASGSWGTAITAYHSMTPGPAADYARRILAVWPGAAAYGLIAPPGCPTTPQTGVPHPSATITRRSSPPRSLPTWRFAARAKL